jgi:hypothetical protein
MIDDSFAMLLALSMAAQSPHEAAALVSLPTIHTYLTARGWTPGKIPPWTFGRGIVWDAPPSTHGDDYGVLFPNSEEPRDYAMVLVDAANGVAIEESRNGKNVLAAWLFAQWQTGTFRVTP